MKFSEEIRTSFNVFSGILLSLIGIIMWTISITFALSVMKIILVIATFSTGYMFIKVYSRLPTKKEYLQMVGFGSFVYIVLLMFLFYKLHGLSFLQDIYNYMINFDVAVWLSSLVVLASPVLIISIFFSRIIFKGMFLNMKKEYYKKYMPFLGDKAIENMLQIALEDTGCEDRKHKECKKSIHSLISLINDENIILLAYGQEVLVWDNSDILNPKQINKYFLDHCIDNMFVLDDSTIVCYEKGHCGKITLLNVSDLHNITKYSSHDIKYLDVLIKVDENMLACTYGGYILLLDVNKRRKIKSLDEYYIDTHGGTLGDLVAYDNMLICAYHFTKLDISKPRKIKFIDNNKVSLDYYNFVKINDMLGYCWRGDYGGGSFVLESSPDFKYKGGYGVEYCLSSMIVIDNYTVAAINSGKIILLDISNADKIELLSECHITKFNLLGYEEVNRIVKLSDTCIGYYGGNSIVYLDIANKRKVKVKEEYSLVVNEKLQQEN